MLLDFECRLMSIISIHCLFCLLFCIPNFLIVAISTFAVIVFFYHTVNNVVMYIFTFDHYCFLIFYLAEYCLGFHLLKRCPMMMSQHFLESIFVFNDYSKHTG